jgi:hypothetical protein
VEAVDRDAIELRITSAGPKGAKLRAGKGINLPDAVLEIDLLGSHSTDALCFAAECADIVGLSFISRAHEVQRVNAYLDQHGRPEIGMILKIETRRAFEQLPGMLLPPQATLAVASTPSFRVRPHRPRSNAIRLTISHSQSPRPWPTTVGREDGAGAEFRDADVLRVPRSTRGHTRRRLPGEPFTHQGAGTPMIQTLLHAGQTTKRLLRNRRASGQSSPTPGSRPCWRRGTPPFLSVPVLPLWTQDIGSRSSISTHTTEPPRP